MLTKGFAILCAVVLLCVAGMTLLPLAHAEQYRVGDAEISANLKELKVNWTSGAVHIAYHTGNTVVISEKTTGMITEDMRMRWRLEGDTLTVEYEQPGFHLFSLFPHEKELTVTLPEGLTLDKAYISATSADLDIPALYADSVNLHATSGDVRAKVSAQVIKGKLTSGDMDLQVTSAVKEIKLESTSGKITLESAWNAEKIVIDATSGDIQAAIKQTGEFKAGSTSGNIHAVLGSARKAEIECTSGKVTLEIGGIEELKVHTTSGNINAYLPEAQGFTAKIETTSGDFAYNLPLSKDGKSYIAGDGSAKVEIYTTSGDVKLSAK